MHIGAAAGGGGGGGGVNVCYFPNSKLLVYCFIKWYTTYCLIKLSTSFIKWSNVKQRFEINIKKNDGNWNTYIQG
jgi:hypothetical protein